MSEIPPEPDTMTAARLQIERMDALLAEGKAAMTLMDQFYQDHEMIPGLGEQILTSEEVPERHRIIFSKLLAELRILDQRIDEIDPNSPQRAPVAVSARAVGNRYRI